MGRGKRAERAVQHVVALRLAASEAGKRAADRLAGMEADLLEEVGDSVPKASAARILGVSTTTLEKWVGRRMLATAPGVNGREEIEAASLYELAAEVEHLRELGQDKALLAAAFQRLAERDTSVQRALEANLGEGFRALRQGRKRELVIPATFGPED